MMMMMMMMMRMLMMMMMMIVRNILWNLRMSNFSWRALQEADDCAKQTFVRLCFDRQASKDNPLCANVSPKIIHCAAFMF